MSATVLVMPRSFGATSDEPMRVLTGAELAVRWLERPTSGVVTEEHIIAALQGADGVIVGVEPLGRQVIESAPSLRAISKYGVGLDNIDLHTARARGIPVGFTPGANSNAVAELTLALIFALTRRVPSADRNIREGKFERVVGFELKGCTLGVVGLGRIGRLVAEKARALGVQVVASEPAPDLDFCRQCSVAVVGLSDLLAEADIVTLHLPLTPETTGIIGREAIARMKRGALLVNTARGALVDEVALAEALEAGRLGGVALDCFASEPPSASPLLKSDTVIATPHMGSHTREAIAAMGVMAAENVVCALNGEPMPYPVDG